MTMNDIMEVLRNGGAGAFVLLTLVQISPVKINPWSWFAKCVGRAINGELITRLDNVESGLRSMRSEIEQHNAVTVRARIVQFGDKLIRGDEPTKDHFDQVLSDVDSYEAYCATHPEFKNSITVLTIKRIKEAYLQLLETGDSPCEPSKKKHQSA